MNESWFVYYGHKLGMSREETMDTRCGEMMDLLACMAISNGANPKNKAKKMSLDEALALR